MPLLKITLSTADESGEVRDTLLAKGTQIISEGLGKDQKLVMVVCESEAIAFGGSREPAAYLEIRSIGALDEDTNASLSGALCKLLHETVSIQPDRVFLNFIDVQRADWGWNGTTYAKR